MITKILVRPYRYKPNTWEADVTLLIQGNEVRRRWKSPMPSRSATERWAREKALGFLANGSRTRRLKQQTKTPALEKTEVPRVLRIRGALDGAVRHRQSPARLHRRQLPAGSRRAPPPDPRRPPARSDRRRVRAAAQGRPRRPPRGLDDQQGARAPQGDPPLGDRVEHNCDDAADQAAQGAQAGEAALQAG
jgi:hypothetical protein